MEAESWCVQPSAAGSSTSQLNYIFGGPKWKPPVATASAVGKFSSRVAKKNPNPFLVCTPFYSSTSLTIFISRSPKKYKEELTSSIFRRPGIFRRRLKMAAESWCVQPSAAGSSTSQLNYIFGGPKWKPPVAPASAVGKFSSRLIIRASHEPLDDTDSKNSKFYKELGMFSLRKRIEDSILRAELLAPTALEHEEARHVKQEEIIRDHDLWDDLGKSNEIVIKLADSAKVVDALKDLKYKVEEAKLITELAELDTVNYELFKQAYFASVDLNKFLDKYEMSKFLEEPYDMEGACLIIEYRCGDFCSETWAGQLTRMDMKWAEKQGHAVRLVERCPAKNGGIKSATIEFKFKYAYGYLSGERGVHRIIGNHKSESNYPKASLAAVDVIPLFLESSPGLLIDDKDLLVSCTSFSKKPGKISSLVSIQHIPTGVEVQSTGERSRVANKIKALNRLKAKLLVILRDQRTSDVSNIKKDDLVDMWSHEARRYVFQPTKMVEDAKTGTQFPDVNAVLNGNIDSLIAAHINTRRAYNVL